ncbi:MAG: Putrescine transport ATP-binding protein PotG [Enterovirga sp.]|nr:Putrescine transport ATP-binding protein PotG [Enterovirga sp.]
MDGLSLDLAEGEFFCLLGPSGCGKSTLLRILAGFEEPDDGEAVLDGASLRQVPPHRRALNMMFQSYALFPHLTVAGNVGYGLRFGDLGRRDRAERVREMLRLVRLDGLGERYPAQLSGGQRQRVALARALARRPRVLLLDEPLAALDRTLREETRAELKDLQGRLGTTFVMVTHDQDEAMTIADRIGIMQAGRLVQVGPPREVYERPRTRFVAGFVGDTNLLEGVVVGQHGGLTRVALPSGGEIAGASETAFSPGAPVAVAVRPERIELRPLAGEPSGLTGEVAEVVFAGPWLECRVKLRGGPVLRVTRPNGAALVPAPGDSVALCVPAGAAVVLP